MLPPTAVATHHSILATFIGWASRVFGAPRPDTGSLMTATQRAPLPAPQRVLLIDDDAMILRALRLLLESDNHEVTVAQGGEAGIAAFLEAMWDSHPYPLVMTDLGMPDVDGREVARAVKAALPSTLVFLLTGCVERLEFEGTPSDVDLILGKPPRRAELREAMRGCLNGKRLST